MIYQQCNCEQLNLRVREIIKDDPTSERHSFATNKENIYCFSYMVISDSRLNINQIENEEHVRNLRIFYTMILVR